MGLGCVFLRGEGDGGLEDTCVRVDDGVSFKSTMRAETWVAHIVKGGKIIAWSYQECT